jgi:ABC-type transport system involved in cytochrome bd biosynthesis fused ATPase/permease subunit
LVPDGQYIFPQSTKADRHPLIFIIVAFFMEFQKTVVIMGLGCYWIVAMILILQIQHLTEDGKHQNALVFPKLGKARSFFKLLTELLASIRCYVLIRISTSN